MGRGKEREDKSQKLVYSVLGYGTINLISQILSVAIVILNKTDLQKDPKVTRDNIWTITCAIEVSPKE